MLASFTVSKIRAFYCLIILTVLNPYIVSECYLPEAACWKRDKNLLVCIHDRRTVIRAPGGAFRGALVVASRLIIHTTHVIAVLLFHFDQIDVYLNAVYSLYRVILR